MAKPKSSFKPQQITLRKIAKNKMTNGGLNQNSSTKSGELVRRETNSVGQGFTNKTWSMIPQKKKKNMSLKQPHN